MVLWAVDHVYGGKDFPTDQERMYTFQTARFNVLGACATI